MDGTVVSETEEQVTLEIPGGTLSFHRSDLLQVEKNEARFVPVEIGPPPKAAKKPQPPSVLSRTYVHPHRRYSLRIPVEWQVARQDEEGVTFTWGGEDSDRAGEGALVIAVTESIPTDQLGRYQAEALTQMQAGDPTLHLLRWGETNVGGFSASLMVYASRSGGRRRILEAYSFTPEAKSYHLTFVADEKRYDRDSRAFASVVRSFKMSPSVAHRLADLAQRWGFTHPLVPPGLLGLIAFFSLLSAARIHRGTILTLGALGLLLGVGAAVCNAFLQEQADYPQYGLYGVWLLLCYGLMRRVNWARLLLLALTAAVTFWLIFVLISSPLLGIHFWWAHIDAFCPQPVQKGFVLGFLLYSVFFFHYFRRAGVVELFQQKLTSRRFRLPDLTRRRRRPASAARPVPPEVPPSDPLVAPGVPLAPPAPEPARPARPPLEWRMILAAGLLATPSLYLLVAALGLLTVLLPPLEVLMVLFPTGSLARWMLGHLLNGLFGFCFGYGVGSRSMGRKRLQALLAFVVFGLTGSAILAVTGSGLQDPAPWLAQGGVIFAGWLLGAQASYRTS